VHTRNMPLERVDLDTIAEKTGGYVGADLENLCREAGLIALRHKKGANKVTSSNFEEALKLVRASTDQETAKLYESLAKEMVTAISKRAKDDNALGYYR